jgi:hypothetical protein
MKTTLLYSYLLIFTDYYKTPQPCNCTIINVSQWPMYVLFRVCIIAFCILACTLL